SGGSWLARPRRPRPAPRRQARSTQRVGKTTGRPRAALPMVVMNATIITMLHRRWNIATAKAELSRVLRPPPRSPQVIQNNAEPSRVLRRARRQPQVIENRGEPVAVVIAFDDYRRLSERERRADRWQAFLDLSAALRAEGGVDLDIPARRPRPSPFAQKRR